MIKQTSPHSNINPPPPYRPSFTSSADSNPLTTKYSGRPSQDSLTTQDSLRQRQQEEKFIIFTRVLIKYLEQKDLQMHDQVKEIIEDCAQRNSCKEVGNESVTAAMRRRLKEVVNDQYWKRAEIYLEQFLKEKQDSKAMTIHPLTKGFTSRKQKEKFLIFTRVLMKYLEQKDLQLHDQVKDIIKDCVQRNNRKEVGYESVTAAMKRRLQEVVNDQHWERAEVYFEHFLERRPSASQHSSDTTHATIGDSNIAGSSQQSLIPPAQLPQYGKLPNSNAKTNEAAVDIANAMDFDSDSDIGIDFDVLVL